MFVHCEWWLMNCKGSLLSEGCIVAMKTMEDLETNTQLSQTTMHGVDNFVKRVLIMLAIALVCTVNDETLFLNICII